MHDKTAKPGVPVMDSVSIQNTLPHRFPFLLVDRITELVPMERVVGLKNVTINEPFFAGHFPGHPIMPGVLILEAMAQTGGLMLSGTENSIAGKLVYFTGIEKAKFRKPVVPGDQLRLEVEMQRYRRGMCKMTGKAFVDDTLVCEAEFSAAVIEQ